MGRPKLTIGYRPKNSHFYPTGEYLSCTLQEAIEHTQKDKGEGYMVYLNDYRCCKLKSPYYVGKKKLMRMNKHQVEKMYNTTKQIENDLPAYWKSIPWFIVKNFTKEEWIAKSDQHRRVVLENFIENGFC